MSSAPTATDWCISNNMKKGGVRSIVIASVTGLILIIAPIAAMLIWKDSEGIKGAQASLIIAMIAGVFAIVFAAIYTARYVTYNKAMLKGRKVQATYLTSEMKSSSGAKDYYCVTYSYKDGDKEITATTGIVYTWEQALALKFAKTFEVTVYKKHSYLTEETEPLIKEHKAEIDEFKRAYAEAFNKYHNS